jgi:transcriptional regulator with XRE-family HTH domain
MTQGELAQKYGIARSYLNGIVRGKRKPGLSLARKMSRDPDIGKTLMQLRPDLRELLREIL